MNDMLDDMIDVLQYMNGLFKAKYPQSNSDRDKEMREMWKN